jgi:hypothetical protein
MNNIQFYRLIMDDEVIAIGKKRSYANLMHIIRGKNSLCNLPVDSFKVFFDIVDVDSIMTSGEFCADCQKKYVIDPNPEKE